MRTRWDGSHGDVERFWYGALEKSEHLRLNLEFMVRSFGSVFGLIEILGQFSRQSAPCLRYPFDFPARYAASKCVSEGRGAFPGT
jgi:hypothetical protein